MLRGATLGCALLLAGGVRVVRDAGKSNTTEGASYKWDVKEYLKGVDEVPNKITFGRDLLKDVGGIEWTGDIPKQLLDITQQTFVGLAARLAEKVHPIVGVMFSVIASLFGWEGEATTMTADEILHEVRGLIRNAKRDLREENADQNLMAMLEHIGAAANNDHEKWHGMDTLFRDRYRVIWSTACWDGRDSCKGSDWRVSSFKPLIFALKFSELMIHSATALMENDQLKDQFADDIVKAARMTEAHFKEYKAARLQFDSARGFKVGTYGRLYAGERPRCGNQYGGYNCPDYFLKDEFIGGDFKVCDYPIASCRSWASTPVNGSYCAAAELVLERKLNACREERKVLIREELNEIGEQASQAVKTARQVQLGHYQRNYPHVLSQSDALCVNRGGAGGSNGNYSRNVGPSRLGACAAWVKNNALCSVWFNYGTRDGWCDCVPSQGVCRPTSVGYHYNVYQLTPAVALSQSDALCVNRGGVGGSNKYSTNVKPSRLGACAAWVEQNAACSVWFNYGTRDGWCDCVPSQGVCRPTPVGYHYNVYQLTESSKSSR